MNCSNRLVAKRGTQGQGDAWLGQETKTPVMAGPAAAEASSPARKTYGAVKKGQRWCCSCGYAVHLAL
jgi:hypothetical protein